MFSASKTAAPVSGSYQVSNSLRFRSSASAYLNRTPSVAGNRTTWTWSAWVKRGTLGAYQAIFVAGEGNSAGTGDTYFTGIAFGPDNKLATYWRSSLAPITTTTAVYRDCSAWYHIVLTANSTTLKAYVNGSEIASVSISGIGAINSTQAHLIGVAGYTAYFGYFDGYMAEVNFIDGQALTPSSFGKYNATTGVWQPARYTGSYGTNGFYLKFNNGTSTTTLGNDSSGNGNNWTTNNISLTAGSTYDWMIDSPTSYAGSSYGVGNYAVANPLDKGSDITASDGNLSISWGGVNGHSIRDSIAMSAGQWYCELTMGTSSVTMGLIAQNISGVGSGSGWPGSSTFGVGGSYGYANSGNKYTNSTSTAYGSSYTTGDVIGIAFDATAGTLTFYKNGSSQGTAFTGISGAYCFAIGYFGGSTGGTPAYANFGQRPFSYTPPTGYKSLCTQNLPAPAIYNGANHMAATTYTGTGSSLSISNSVNSASFQPDLVWIKSRSAATDHALYDVIRGTQDRLESNTTDAAVAADNGLTAFGSSGFTVNTLAQVNTNAATYVGWQWKAGGTAVSNTTGTIPSSVSANTTAGFSVVTYTGTGATSTQTIGHGQGVGLSMVIVKARATGGNDNGWGVSHTSIASPNYLYLNTTAAAANAGPAQGQISIGSGSTFSILAGTAPGTNNFNASGITYVAYCFAAIAGYSAFGSYTGNGSTDGPFVYCGFRPRFILIKGSSFVSNWFIEDASRNGYNVNNGVALRPNLSNAEDGTTTYDLDILSNGFKLRSSSGDSNSSGATFIYACFAENPFQNSLAR